MNGDDVDSAPFILLDLVLLVAKIYQMTLSHVSSDMSMTKHFGT